MYSDYILHDLGQLPYLQVSKQVLHYTPRAVNGWPFIIIRPQHIIIVIIIAIIIIIIIILLGHIACTQVAWSVCLVLYIFTVSPYSK